MPTIIWHNEKNSKVQEGESNSRRDVRPETGDGEETGGTGQLWLWGVRSHWRSGTGCLPDTS